MLRVSFQGGGALGGWDAPAGENHAPEFENFGTFVATDLSSHPFRQTPHEPDRVLARATQQTQRVLSAEVRIRPVEFEQDEQFEQAGGRIGREQDRARAIESCRDEICRAFSFMRRG